MDFTSLQRRPGQVTYGRRSKRARPSTFDAADEEADSQGSLVTDNNTATGSEKAIGLARPSSASPSKDTRGQASPTKARKDSGKGKARQVDPAPPSEFSAPNGESRTGKAPTYTSSAARERTLCPTTPRPKRPRSNPSVHSPRSVNGSIGSPSARSPGTPTRPAQDLRALFEHVSPSAPADLEARTAKQRKREGSPTPLAALGNSATTSQAMEPEGQGTARRPRLVELMAGRRERVSGTSASRMGPDNETGTEQGGQASGSPFASAHLQAARASALKSNHITASADATASSSALPAGGVSAARTYARAGSWRRSSTEPSTRLGLATDAGSYSKPEHWPSDVQYTQENMEAQSQPQMFSPGASGSPSGLGSRSRSMLRANSGQGELRLGGHMGADAGGAGGASQGRTSSLGVAGSGARRTYGLQRSFLTEIDPAFSDMGMSSGLDNVWSGGVSRDTQSGGASGMFGSSHGKVEGDKGLDALVEGAQARMGPLARFAPMPRQRESYAELRRKWGDGEESGDEDDEDSKMASELKSITQLRSSGELRRFQDELEYLLSGLDASQSLGVRRTSALELVRKSAGASGRDSEMEGAAAGLEFLRRLKATDAIGRVWGLLRTAGGGEGDEVLDATLVVFLSQLTQHQAHTEPLLREAQWGPDVYYALGTMLKRSIASDDNGGKDGLAKLMRGAKIQRSEEALLTTLRDLVSHASVLPPNSTNITLRNLIVAIFCSLAAFKPRTGFNPLASIASALPSARSGRALQGGADDRSMVPDSQGELAGEDSAILQIIVRSFWIEADKARERVDCFSRGLELIPARSSEASGEVAPDIEHLDLCLRLFELCTAPFNPNTVEASLCAPNDTHALASNMIAVAQTCHLLSLPNPDVSGAGADEPEGGKEGKGKEGTTVRAVEALLGLLKVLLQLTQTSEEWCNALLGCGPALGTILRLVLVSAHSLDSAKTETETKTKSKAGSSQDKPKRGSSRPRSPTKTTKTSKAGANTADAPSSPAASASASDANAEDDKEDGEQRASEARALLFDLLCFALGLFTNLLEIVPSVKDDVRKIELDPACRRRGCVHRCRCAEKLPAVTHVARLYARQGRKAKAADESDVDATFLTGYLAIALGLLMLDSPPNQQLIMRELSSLEPDAHASQSHPQPQLQRERQGAGVAEKAPLRNLIDTLEEFAALHDTARRRAAAALGGDDGEGEGEGDAGANTSREDLPGIAASSDAIESQAHTRARADVNSQREGEYGLVTQIAVRLRELLEQEEELV